MLPTVKSESLDRRSHFKTSKCLLEAYGASLRERAWRERAILELGPGAFSFGDRQPLVEFYTF